jgi:ligand-binding sensor domain-containing protein
VGGKLLGNTLVQYSAQQLADAIAAGGSSNPAPRVIIDSAVFNKPYRHAFDVNSNLWIGNNAGDNLLEFTPAQLARTGSRTPATITNAATKDILDACRASAFDADGDLWESSGRTHQLVQYSMRSGRPVPISTTDVTLEDGVTPTNLAGLALDDADNLWATEGLITIS